MLPPDGLPAKKCISGDTEYQWKVLTVNEEHGNARRGEESGEQVKICGYLSDVKARENHIDAVEEMSTQSKHICQIQYLAARMETP